MSAPTPHERDHKIPSDLGEARRVQTEIEDALERFEYTEHDKFKIKLALEEALVNAIKHGNQMDPDKFVALSYRITSDVFHIQIADEGVGFNPKDVPDPTLPENIEKGSGRGVFIINELMTSVEYVPPGNVLVMSKRRGDTE